MKKIYIVILAFFLGISSLVGQDLAAVLEKMPRDIVYGLTPEMKEELSENPTDTAFHVSTLIYEKIKREAINADFMALKTSDVGRIEIRLLPLINGSKIVCVVQTVESVVADSKIYFYTDQWEPIDSSSLFPQTETDWFIKQGVDKSNERFQHAMVALSLMKPMKFVLSPNEAMVEITYDPKSFLSFDDYKLVEPFLTQEAKMLYWDKTRFK